MSSENKITMTRVIVGVASVGATLALVYLYNKYQEKKGSQDGSSASSGGSRLRRQSAKGEVTKKVTFKTAEDEEDKKVVNSAGSTSAPESSNSKFKELNKQPSPLTPDLQPVVAATHAATKADNDVCSEGQRIRDPERSSSEILSTALNDNSIDTTNSYESNSTLKLEDSVTTTTNFSAASASPVVAADVVQQEVITRSLNKPLMTSTPVSGKDSSGSVPLRVAAAVFEPHSDLQSSAQVDATKAPSTSSVTPETTDYDAFSFRKEMRIPREIVPGLIGKKGCNIKGIQSQSGTTINFHDETLDNGDRLCVIRGAPGNVTIAESMIEKFIMEQPTVYTETLTVPLSAVGRIIGRGGETIRSIQELSKARVNVESHNHYGTGDAGPTRSITIKGTEEQINVAKQLIVEKVDEERNLRKTIDIATSSRTPRRGGGVSPSLTSPGSLGSSSSTKHFGSTEAVLPLKDGNLEVFVSCVYHPNDFWIQMVGRDSIELDKLCESMTDYYNGRNEQNELQISAGDIVAAPFEVDGKIYRAKVMRIDDSGVEVSYLDYGDRRVLPSTEIYALHPNFLKLRFQAIQATLNLGSIGDTWGDEVINEFCDRTYCAQWQSLTAKVTDYLKDVEDGHDVIWIELLDKDVNIGEELIRKGLATSKGPSGCNGAQGVPRKSYAAAALGVNNSSLLEPLITSTDPTVLESLENDRNGN